jgi:hypothetical protein
MQSAPAIKDNISQKGLYMLAEIRPKFLYAAPPSLQKLQNA